MLKHCRENPCRASGAGLQTQITFAGFCFLVLAVLVLFLPGGCLEFDGMVGLASSVPGSGSVFDNGSTLSIDGLPDGVSGNTPLIPVPAAGSTSDNTSGGSGPDNGTTPTPTPILTVTPTPIVVGPDNTSSAAALRISADVVEEDDLAATLTVVCRAYTLDAGQLPAGGYSWRFDDVEGGQVMGSDGTIRHSFTGTGVHTIGLLVTLAGISSPVSVPTAEGASRILIVIQPVVSGYVRNSAGSPLAGITVAADQGGYQNATDKNGCYKFKVPFGWSGTIRPQSTTYSFGPASYSYTRVSSSLPQQNFTATVVAPANTPPVANAGPDQVLSDSDDNGTESVTLDGSGSTDDKGVVSYVWTEGQTALGSGVRVTAWLAIGIHTVTLTVADKEGLTSTASATVTVRSIRTPLAEDFNQRVIRDASCSATNRLFLRASTSNGRHLNYQIVSLPSHGRLMDEKNTLTIGAVPYALSSDRLKYVPDLGQAAGSQDQFTWRAIDDSGNGSNAATVTITLVDWFAPIGVPVPEFGIQESHRMYAGQLYDYDGDNVSESPYKDAGNGPYTHYVDVSNSAATDYNNSYGSPALPRQSIPVNLRPGSVVEVHGGPYTGGTLYGGSCIGITGVGTAQKPIFIRGVSQDHKALIKKPMLMRGAYIILENMDVDGWTIYNDVGIAVLSPNDHVAIRHSEVHNGPDATTSGIAVITWDFSDLTQRNDHVVVYDDRTGNNGSWSVTTGDEDHHGMSIGGLARRVWIIDNEMYHNSGDGIQVNGSRADTHHLYLGRNVSWENKQTGLWTKESSDIIFSQNIAFNHKPSASSGGTGMGFQYGPERVWFLYNRSYNNTSGIEAGSNFGSPNDGKYAYMIGNRLFNTPGPGINFWGNTGLSVYVVNNTIVNTGGGVCGVGSLAVHITNNIIANMTGGAFHLSILYGDMADASDMDNNLVYQSGGNAQINWGGLIGPFSYVRSRTGKGQTSVEADPQMVNPADDDFRPAGSSPAVDSGKTSDVYDTFQNLYGIDIRMDAEGRARPADGRGTGTPQWDMGALEYVR